MNIIKFLLIIFVFAAFFFLIKHYNDLENYSPNKNENKIPIIEADNKPYKILPPPEDLDDPLQNSCSLNDEC
tara:strand:- start:101 stop:316 length:216 start_codon:yes stop_codon:yes gene_type:complete